jgi:hypothetical protein
VDVVADMVDLLTTTMTVVALLAATALVVTTTTVVAPHHHAAGTTTILATTATDHHHRVEAVLPSTTTPHLAAATPRSATADHLHLAVEATSQSRTRTDTVDVSHTEVVLPALHREMVAEVTTAATTHLLRGRLTGEYNSPKMERWRRVLNVNPSENLDPRTSRTPILSLFTTQRSQQSLLLV